MSYSIIHYIFFGQPAINFYTKIWIFPPFNYVFEHPTKCLNKKCIYWQLILRLSTPKLHLPQFRTMCASTDSEAMVFVYIAQDPEQ